MRTLILLLASCAMLIIVSTCSAEEYTIKPRIYDVTPNDGVFDAGTSSNPYVIEDSRGRQVGTIKPRIYDVNPNDGVLDAGTSSNPYILDTDRY